MKKGPDPRTEGAWLAHRHWVGVYGGNSYPDKVSLVSDEETEPITLEEWKRRNK